MKDIRQDIIKIIGPIAGGMCDGEVLYRLDEVNRKQYINAIIDASVQIAFHIVTSIDAKIVELINPEVE